MDRKKAWILLSIALAGCGRFHSTKAADDSPAIPEDSGTFIEMADATETPLDTPKLAFIALGARALVGDRGDVVFTSSSAELVTDDRNGSGDVFLYNNESAELRRVNLSNKGEEAELFLKETPHEPIPAVSTPVAMSADGGLVLFASSSRNLTSDPPNIGEGPDLFLRNVLDGSTLLVSRTYDGSARDGASLGGGISADGRFIVFASWSSRIVPGDSNGRTDTFVLDRTNDEIARLSLGISGAEPDGHCGASSLSEDGRRAAGPCHATNVVEGDATSAGDVLLFDMKSDAVELVSVSSSEIQSNLTPSVSGVSISGDGRFVVFGDLGDNLVAADTNGNVPDVFIRDTAQGITELVSATPDGEAASARSFASNAAVSRDGRFVVFQSDSDDIVAHDTNGHTDVFLRDREREVTVRLSENPVTHTSDGGSYSASISPNGRWIAFETTADMLTSQGSGRSVVRSTNPFVD